MGTKPEEKEGFSAAEVKAISINADLLRAIVDRFVSRVHSEFIIAQPSFAFVNTVDIVGQCNSDGASAPMAAKGKKTKDLPLIRFTRWCFSHSAALIGPGQHGLIAAANQGDGHDDARVCFSEWCKSLATVRLFFFVFFFK